MKNKPIIIIAGEPYSIFFEIYFKSLKKKIYKKYKKSNYNNRIKKITY